MIQIKAHTAKCRRAKASYTVAGRVGKVGRGRRRSHRVRVRVGPGGVRGGRGEVGLDTVVWPETQPRGMSACVRACVRACVCVCDAHTNERASNHHCARVLPACLS